MFMPARRDKKLHAWMKKGKKTTNQELHSREDTASRIVSTATRLFADTGYDGTSVKDICDAADVNIAAIHYHFGSKEGLYRHIIEQFGTERLEFARRTLQDPQSVDDFKVRLEIFLTQTLEAMIRQKDIIRIVQRDVEMADSRSKEMYLDPIVKHGGKLMEFFDHARKKGIVATHVEPFTAAGFLMSSVIHQTRNERILKKFTGHSLADETFRNHWIQQMLCILTEGIIAKQPVERGEK
jgi:AcrR family transcriptional regulator